jgi:plastocyanin
MPSLPGANPGACAASALLYNPACMSPTRSALLAAFLLLLAGSGCSGSDGADGGAGSKPSTGVTASDGRVLISLSAFKPNHIQVPVGKEVVWTVDAGSHTVVADDFSFSSPIMSAGEFRHTFTAPGTFAYHCVIQTKMKGTVVVTG